MEKAVFQAKLSNLEKMFDFIRAGAGHQGFSAEQVNKIQLACEEALVNVINYAYPGKEGDLEIRVENKPNGMDIILSDSGIAFDPLSLPDPDITAPMEKRRIGGLGIFMMKKIMDSVAYRRENGRNILTMTKLNTCCEVEEGAKSAPGQPAACRWPIAFMKKETYAKGQPIFKKGDAADRMFYIAKGAIRLVEINKVIPEGEVIGEMGVFSPLKERTATAVCERDLEAYTMGHDEIITFFGKDPEMAIELIRLSIKRFIENLKAETTAKERMASELRIAQEIQASMLPTVFPQRKEFEIFAMMEPAKEVGGDFYDFFFIDVNRLCFVIGDVSGKGVPAALFMAITKTLIKNEARRCKDTNEILANVNSILVPDNPSCLFVTVFCAVLDIRTGEVQFCNAGHNPPLLMQKKGGVEFIKSSKGFVVGVMENCACSYNNLKLESGDAILLYTDGVTEAMDPEQKQFSEPRLKELLAGLKDKPMKELTDTMRAEVLKFVRGAAQSDDITMLALKYTGD
jgi:serine phosphatase RsbU (regulator of sigma subunit)/anti-sigma regulatory factor (Ser/Thr protein kinase)